MPFRIFASGGIEKIELALNCNEDVIGFIADNAAGVQKTFKESGNRDVVLDFIEKVLGMVVTEDSDARDIKFVSIEFLSTEASFNYNPPLPPSISSMILSTSTLSSEESSVDGDNNYNNEDDDDDSFKEGVTVGANVNLRDFSIFVAPSKALPLEVKLIPQTKAEWLLETNNGEGVDDNDDIDDCYKLALPTDVILAKYRLEYSEKLNEEPKHFITLSVSGVKIETDGAINPIMDFAKRPTNPELFKQLQEQQKNGLRKNFGDGVNLDIQLCDIDFMHSDSKSKSPLKASFKLLPRSEAGILYLRDKFTYKATQMRIKHENDISELNSVIDKSKSSISELERMLIESKIALANTTAEKEEFLGLARRLQREKRTLENSVLQTKQELDSFSKLFKAKSDEEMVKVFQSSLKNFFEENERYSKENDALRAENDNLTRQMESMRLKHQEEISDIQKQLGDSIKMLQEENARLKEMVANRDKSLEEAQKGLMDRQLLAEKLLEAERKMDTQRRMADNALRKSSFKSTSMPTVVVTQNMVQYASTIENVTTARTLGLDSDSSNVYSSGIDVLSTPADEPSQPTKPLVKQGQQPQQPQQPPLPQSKPPQKHHAVPQAKPPSLPQVPSAPPPKKPPPPSHQPPPPPSSQSIPTTTMTTTTMTTTAATAVPTSSPSPQPLSSSSSSLSVTVSQQSNTVPHHIQKPLAPPPPPPPQSTQFSNINYHQQGQPPPPPRPKKAFDHTHEMDDHSKRRKIASGFNRFKSHINNGVTKMETKLNK